jgi:hypothetical protein
MGGWKFSGLYQSHDFVLTAGEDRSVGEKLKLILHGFSGRDKE